MDDRISARRIERGWTQADLAERAGVTRQLVSALEAGRHVPNVVAAMGIASALQVTVEDLFGDEPEPVDALDVAAPAGSPVSVARVGGRLVTAAGAHGLLGAEAWGVADAVVADTLTWLPGRSPASLLIAGCDPAIGLLSGVLDRSGHRMLGLHASTGRSVDALAAGRVHGVLVHGRASELPEPPVPVRRWRVARWQVGLCAPSGRRTAPSIDELASRRLKVVQRDAGAGSQRAFERALRAAGAPELPGPIGEGHLDVARRVSYGGADAGVLMEAAAAVFGLRFSALEEHGVELWLAEEWRDLPAVTALVEALLGREFQAQLGLLPGYDITECGTELRVS
ncbi:substrate-binding domain-containing protein [Cumulibacter soli]|uniref:substrate-binding domain-containing protein n=1 Tax=Cumulibacter soli TaxID=2546344 RepID=UPI001067735F|nr:substrate-binding domain-containing protein [Cumulibacter soli]